MKQPQIGLSDNQRRGSIDSLNAALCNEHILLIKTKKAHWDVVGPQFLSVHEMLDGQYERINTYVDQLAERTRALGGLPVATAKGFIEGATLKEHPEPVQDVTKILNGLLEDHEHVVCQLRDAVEQTELRFHDRGTSDFFVGLMRAHEEMAWFLRSFLEGADVRPDTQRTRSRGLSPLA